MALRYTLADIRRETFRAARRERRCVCPFHACKRDPLSLWNATVSDAKRTREERVPLCELCRSALAATSGEARGCYLSTDKFTKCPDCGSALRWPKDRTVNALTCRCEKRWTQVGPTGGLG